MNRGLKNIRKIMSMILIFAFVIAYAVLPISTFASVSYTEPSDLTEGKLYNFENQNIRIKSNMLIDGSTVDTATADIELQKERRVAGWGWSTKDDGTGNTVLKTGKSDNTHYPTGGSLRLNDDGKFCILKPAQTYYVTIKYKVVSSQKTYVDNGNTYPTEDNKSVLTIGYDAPVGTEVNIGDRMGKISTTLATLVNIGNNTNVFTSVDEYGVETTKNVGVWYTEELYFSTPAVFSGSSQHFAIYNNCFTGVEIWVDDIYILETPTVNLMLNGGSGVEVKQPAVVGKPINIPEPSREGYSFAGWYNDLYCTDSFDDTVFTEENCSTTLYAKWEKNLNTHTVDFFDYETGSEEDGNYRQNVVLNENTYTSHNFTVVSAGTEDGRKQLFFNGFEEITVKNRAYFPMGNIDGNIRLKSNTTYTVLVDYDMNCAMTGAKYGLKIFTASASDVNDTPVTVFDSQMPSGEYREFITFTTGDIAAGKDAAYIEISSKNSNVVDVTFKRIKFIQIDDGMSFIRAYDNLNNKTYEFLGYTGDNVDLPVLSANSNFVFGGWYTDASFVTKHNGKFGSEKNVVIYSYWGNKPVDFENFVPALENSYCTIGSGISIVKDTTSYSGEKLLKYTYNYLPNYFERDANAASLAIVYDQTTYKLTFKYKLDTSVDDVQIKFFTAHRSNRWAYITNYDEATYTIYAKEAGDGWKEGVVYLTTDFVKPDHSDGLFVSFNPVVEGETVVCFDDFTVDAVMAETGIVAFLGKDGKSGLYKRVSVGATVSAPEDQPDEYFSTFDGWYFDEEYTVPFTPTTVNKGITYVYSKWIRNAEDFEGYVYENESVIADGNNTVLKNGEALLGEAENNATYLVNYRFKTNTAGTKVYLKSANKADGSKNATLYDEEGSVFTASEELADGEWHDVKRYISTSFAYDETDIGNMLYAVAEGDISIDDIRISKIDVVLDKGSSVLKDEEEQSLNSQAMRFFYSYESENGATITVDGEKLTLVERGIVLKNAKTSGAVTLSKAESGEEGYLTKSKTYEFGKYWSYDAAGGNYFVAKYASFPSKISADIDFNKYISLPSVSAQGSDYSNYISATNGYLEKQKISDNSDVCTKLYNVQIWPSREVIVLADESGAAIQVKNGKTYNVDITYKVPSISGNITMNVNAGLSVDRRTAVPDGDKVRNSAQSIGYALEETATDPSFTSFAWDSTWTADGNRPYGVTGTSDEWQTVTYKFTTAEDMTGYLPVVMLSVNMAGIANGVGSEMLIKDITIYESDYEGEESGLVFTDGEKSSGTEANGVYMPDSMPKASAGEGKYFAGWADKDGKIVVKDGVAAESGKIVYSYYITGLYKSDIRDITARGYIKAKDADGNVYTFYSREQSSCVKDVKAISKEKTDKDVHTFAGKNWNRFTIVNPKTMPYIYGMQIENLIEYAAGFGVTLNRVTEKAKVTPYEVVIGDTTRDASDLVSVKDENEYIIAVKGTKVIIKGGSDIATAQAVSDFIEYLKFKDSLDCGADLYDGFVMTGEYLPASDNYVLTFGEEFDTLDTNIWKSYAGYDYGYFYGSSVLGGSYGNRSIDGNPVRTISGETKKLVDVRDGNLVLGTARVTPTDPKDIDMNVEFMHSNVSTFYTMLYKYGMLEIRSDVADVPSTTSLWVNAGSSLVEGQRQGCTTEYDIIENYGRSNYFASAIHQWSSNPITGQLDHFAPDSTRITGNAEQVYKPDIDENSIYDNYHIYTFLWENDKIVFAFDGVKYCEYDIPDWYRENMANCIVLLSRLGDASYGTKYLPDVHGDYYETLVDYIRIYQIEDMGSEMHWAE